MKKIKSAFITLNFFLYVCFVYLNILYLMMMMITTTTTILLFFPTYINYSNIFNIY